ncbi:MAG: hypothetical protein IJ328_01825 [Muribaculaceae bacterium]|nr:hypothetical protein [Muribaculaceae bacterium]
MWESNEYRIKLRKGLALAERRMLKHKAVLDELVIESTPEGRIIETPAAKLLEDHYGYHINK